MTSTRELVIPKPKFCLITTSRGDQPAIVVVNESLLHFDARDIFAWHLVISIQVETLAANGLPTGDENAIIADLEEVLEKELQTARTDLGSDNVLFEARETCCGQRTNHYRVNDPKIANRVLTRCVKTYSSREWSYEIRNDPAWSETRIFRDLLKSAQAPP